ncbi:MAG: toxin-antitoxin system HicB family antitoxin [Treponema sp.]|nr:toxin-antitoxin system HicB family antitoxin [Treponema sp.]
MKVHKEVAVRAKKLKMSINSFVEKALADEIAALR